MIIPLEKLLSVPGNRYIFTKATLKAVDKIANMKGYPEDEFNWKVVPNILRLMLDGNIHFNVDEKTE